MTGCSFSDRRDLRGDPTVRTWTHTSEPADSKGAHAVEFSKTVAPCREGVTFERTLPASRGSWGRTEQSIKLGAGCWAPGQTRRFRAPRGGSIRTVAATASRGSPSGRFGSASPAGSLARRAGRGHGSNLVEPLESRCRRGSRALALARASRAAARARARPGARPAIGPRGAPLPAAGAIAAPGAASADTQAPAPGFRRALHQPTRRRRRRGAAGRWLTRSAGAGSAACPPGASARPGARPARRGRPPPAARRRA
jgi:hypothetical protein